jgi:hypothetical protein
MRKVSDADFAEIGGRLRARALDLMQQLDRPAAAASAEPVPRRVATGECAACGTSNDVDARFCKNCGGKLA